MTSFILLQIAQKTTNPQQVEDSIQILLKGGWILLPILLMSIVNIYLIVERWYVIKGATKKQNILPVIAPMIKEGKIDLAISTCEMSNQPAGRVMASGLRTIGYPIAEVQEAMEAEARQQVDYLTKGMHYLAIIASVAPMFGFLGTIFGVIKIFYSISLSDNISIGIISGGLYQKMISSASGLLVGMIAFAGYHLLSARIDKISSSIEYQCNQLVALLRRNN
ncbi:MAG: MotA/TolQ/ExbB proton channel family protein [Bacteroidota bacterium]|nr:MotA/TolQ/ExbB proton channel family protein [Bacteroidota bacterium]MDP4205259.1 MotA/TolQ/ExbB proton channel family protein [Bacteroidota bacterium]